MKAKQLNTRHRSKLNFYAVLFSLFFIHYIVCPTPVALGGDLPENPIVQAGAPTITTEGKDMTVNAGAHDKTWVDWQGGFNIGAQNSVNNVGPSAAAVILHQDVSGAISNIQGALNGNCNVFLLNASGVLFAPGASVNVGGLVVSTLKMSMDDFMSGNYAFNSGNIANMGSIVNAGTITANTPAGVTFLGGSIRNEGVINANLGTVNLASGSEVTLNANNDGSIQVAVNKQILSNVYDKDGNKVSIGVDNVGEINANGGQVYIQAEAVNDVFGTLINQAGVVKAGSMVEKNGKITLVSNSDGIVQNTGTLDASAVEAGAKGGTVEMTGSKVGQFGTVHADAIDGDGGNVNLYASDVLAITGLTTANAGLVGDGGTVIALSPDTTLFWSDAIIEARGGTLSGDGGFVEISGFKNTIFQGTVDLTANNGSRGTLFIDPQDITITVGGATAVAGNNTFILPNPDGSGTSDFSAANIVTALNGADLVLQANRDITVTSAVDSSAGGVGNLTMQAGRSITLNADIKLNGSFTATANETVANGVQNAMRTGETVAVFTMADGITIDTTTSNTNISITLSTGPTTNNSSGDITLEHLNAGGGNILVTNNGPTANSGIVRASSSVLLTGAKVTLDVNGAGGAGEIGSNGSEIRVTTTNLEARGQSNGIYILSPTQGLTIGGASAGLTGISTAGNGAVAVTASFRRHYFCWWRRRSYKYRRWCCQRNRNCW